MTPEQVLTVYDQAYADSYDDQFLLSKAWGPKAEMEHDFLARILREDDRWLDVACGTGYFLSLFPQLERAGLDLSPAMLEAARRANPGVPFFAGDFRDPRPDWQDKWSLVTCMWYAYSLVESMADIKRLVANLAAWTSEDGRCFVPLFNPEKVCKVRIPYCEPDYFGGPFYITGVTWTWIGPEGKVHENLVSPQVEHMQEMFSEHFSTVEVISYARNQAFPFKGIFASEKKSPHR